MKDFLNQEIDINELLKNNHEKNNKESFNKLNLEKIDEIFNVLNYSIQNITNDVKDLKKQDDNETIIK